MDPLHESQQRVLAAFEGGIEPVRVSGLYRLGMAVVALAMVLLPLIYLAIIAGTAWGVWYHAVNHHNLFEEMSFSMPQNDPGSLSPQQNADILAYMLHRGTYPTGPTELATDLEVLKTVKFVATKP